MSQKKSSGRVKPAYYAGIAVMVIVGMATAVFSINMEFKPTAKPTETDVPTEPASSVEKSPQTDDKSETAPETTTVTTTAATVTTTKQTAPATTATKAPTKPQTVKGSPVQGDYACFNDSAFLGNSRFEGLKNLGLVPNVYTKVGLNVKTALTATGSDGASIIGKLNSGEKFENVFIMFGDNEIGYSDSWIISNYKTLVNKVKEYQPEANIYVVSILPISKAASDKNTYNYSNGRIVEMNAQIRNMCSSLGVGYIDVWAAMADDNGRLPDSASSDGVHFGKSYYCIMLNCIKSKLGY